MALSLWFSNTETQNTVGYDWLNSRCCLAVLVQPNTCKQVYFLRKCVYGRFYLLIWLLSFKILWYGARDRVINRDSFSPIGNVFYACFLSDISLPSDISLRSDISLCSEISLRCDNLTDCFEKWLPYHEWLSCEYKTHTKERQKYLPRIHSSYSYCHRIMWPGDLSLCVISTIYWSYSLNQEITVFSKAPEPALGPTQPRSKATESLSVGKKRPVM